MTAFTLYFKFPNVSIAGRGLWAFRLQVKNESDPKYQLNVVSRIYFGTTMKLPHTTNIITTFDSGNNQWDIMQVIYINICYVNSVVWIFGISDVSIHMPGSSSGNMNVMCKLL